MNLSRCERGHFYDGEKFASCPHCAQGAQMDDSMTTVFTEDLTNGSGVTEPMGVTTPIQSVTPIQAIPDPMQAFQAASQSVETLAINQDNVSMTAEADDDHTVAFYDDIFAPQPTENKQVESRPAPRVSTPCTGWVVALNGVHLGQDFRLKVGKNFIGRDLSMDIVLDEDKSVSRNKHAIVVYEPKQHLYLVQPGESSELVYLNNNVVLNPMQLKAYDIITVGEVDLLFIPLCGEKFNWTDMLQKRQG